MDKEKKEVKKTPKKTTTTKKATAKPAAKNTTVKKVTEQKETPKKVVKKDTTKPVVKAEKKVTVKKETAKTAPKKKTIVKKEVKKTSAEEVKPVVKEEKVEKVVTETVPKKKISKELFEIRKKRYIVEAVIITIVVLIALLLLCNKTFLKTNYKTNSINVSLPRFSYYVSDKDNVVKFNTLRKSAYLEEWKNEYLEGFIFYSCAEGNNTFYYNEETKTLIKKINVTKKFAVKTIEIVYDARTPEEVCGLR